MRKNNKLRIGLFLAILFVFAIIFNCRTSKNSVQKHKENFSKEEIQLNKFDSVSKIDKLTKIDNSFKSQQTDFKQKLDISFNGLTNDDEFEFKFTENGFTAKGKGSVNQKSETNKKDSATSNKVDEVQKENSDVRKNGTVESKSEENQTKIDKDKQNESVGFNWNFMIVMIILGVVALILFWKFGLPKIRKG